MVSMMLKQSASAVHSLLILILYLLAMIMMLSSSCMSMDMEMPMEVTTRTSLASESTQGDVNNDNDNSIDIDIDIAKDPSIHEHEHEHGTIQQSQQEEQQSSYEYSYHTTSTTSTSTPRTPSLTHFEMEIQKSEIDFTPILNQMNHNPNHIDNHDNDNVELDHIHEASKLVMQELTSSLQTRLSQIFTNTKTQSCRAKIAQHFSYFINAIGNERAELPFHTVKFHSNSGTGYNDSCPEHHIDPYNLPPNTTVESIMNRKYQPPRDQAEYIHPSELKLLYGILMHGDANSTLRLINTLYEEGHEHGHTFVIHVDGKEESDVAFGILKEYARTREYVHLVPEEYRVRVNWGGYSMVNATMQIFKYCFGLLGDDGGGGNGTPLEFHKFVHISASSYPLKSNTEIRNKIASYPLDANLLHTIMKPLNAPPSSFHYYVECDDAVHRISRLPPLTQATHNAELYTSSQWFVLSREFMEYMARGDRTPDSFVYEYMQYAEHVVVADEIFFGTVLRNTRFCTKHHNDNLLYLQFDQWESDIDAESGERDGRKCLSPDPDRCGRSPTLLTVDDYFALELSDSLFARKFSQHDTEVLDLMDKHRALDEIRLADMAAGNHTPPAFTVNTRFEGHGVLIVAKETVNSTAPLCLGLGPQGYKVKLVPCFHDVIVPNLSKGWETGAVIEQEVPANSRWEIGPCSSDGSLNRRYDTAEMESKRGKYNSPHCMIKQLGGLRSGRCLDIQGDRVEPGGQMQVYPCLKKWHQMFGFGSEEAEAVAVSPTGTVHASLPKNVMRTILHKGKDQAPHLCIGASGRGDNRYQPWIEDEHKVDLNAIDFVPLEEELDGFRQSGKTPPLQLWEDKYLVSMPCSDTTSLIQFLFVPFIVEDAVGDEGKDNNDQEDHLDVHSSKILTDGANVKQDRKEGAFLKDEL